MGVGVGAGVGVSVGVDVGVEVGVDVGSGVGVSVGVGVLVGSGVGVSVGVGVGVGVGTGVSVGVGIGVGVGVGVGPRHSWGQSPYSGPDTRKCLFGSYSDQSMHLVSPSVGGGVQFVYVSFPFSVHGTPAIAGSAQPHPSHGQESCKTVHLPS